MTDHWADLSQFRADGRRVLRWIRRQGVVMCGDPAKRERARDILLPVFRALEDVIRPVPLVALYLYRQTDQPPSLRTTSGTPMRDVDGVEWVDATPDRGKLHAIGGQGTRNFCFFTSWPTFSEVGSTPRRSTGSLTA